ncbi:MAG: DUF1844 domain-containing protein [Proteobacteria bacterium]|nr:DUF1844 domain-containing protein [Pseudomonadota bacterium]MCP4921026.1 DUF1844 domain-containing protein [Pseudomonadota bacterium]
MSDAAAPRPPETPDLQVSFSSFLVSLGRAALAQLGFTEKGRVDPDFEGASQTIQLIQVLQEKTSGNLDEEETALLESILVELRLKTKEAKSS